MKTNLEYEMFLSGYLEALSDIDGKQREFGARVRVFDSDKQDSLQDIKKAFPSLKYDEILDKKRFFDFYSLKYILQRVLLINPFETDKIPKDNLDNVRGYVVFHLLDYIDFAFDDASYRFGHNKRFELIAISSQSVNYLFFVLSHDTKRVIIKFYVNKKYHSNQEFIKWYQDIIKDEYEYSKSKIKNLGISCISNALDKFVFKRYNRDDIIYTAYQISLLFNSINSKALDIILTQEDISQNKLIELFGQLLVDVGIELNSPDKVAFIYIIKACIISEYKPQEIYKQTIDIIQEYNQKFLPQDKRESNQNGALISPLIEKFLQEIEYLSTLKDSDIQTKVQILCKEMVDGFKLWSDTSE